MPTSEILFTGYRAEFGLETVKMWRAAFQRAMGLEQHNRLEELTGHLNYFSTFAASASRIALDANTSSVVGLMTLSGQELHHLYVNIDYQGRGIGTKFIETAKAESPQGLELYTFQQNTGAQRFYLRHGFQEVARGFADLADNPWAGSKAELADIKYRWTA